MPRVVPILRILSASLLSCAFYFAYFLGELGSLRVLVISIAFMAITLEIWLLPLPRQKRLFWVLSLGFYTGAGIALTEFLASQREDRLIAVNGQHLLVLLPLFAVLGMLIYRSCHGRHYLSVFLGFAALVSILAIAEATLDRSLLGRDLQFLTSQREGLARAIVGSEHVLVLGASLAVAVPLTIKISRTALRLPLTALLVAGCWASGSRAPAAICTLVACAIAFPVVRTFFQRRLWILYSGTTAIILGLTYMASFVWKPYIAGATGLEYSSNYRGASYSLMPQMLLEHPFGYLLGGAPFGVWMADSELRGSVDMAVSSDSEIVFAIFGLGWLGLIFYLTSLIISIAAIKFDMAVGLASLSLTVIGLSLSLHGWDGMSLIWYLLLGVCVYLVFRGHLDGSPLASRFRARTPNLTKRTMMGTK